MMSALRGVSTQHRITGRIGGWDLWLVIYIYILYQRYVYNMYTETNKTRVLNHVVVTGKVQIDMDRTRLNHFIPTASKYIICVIDGLLIRAVSQ